MYSSFQFPIQLQRQCSRCSRNFIFILQCHLLFIIQACSGSCCIHHTLMNRRNVAMFVFHTSSFHIKILSKRAYFLIAVGALYSCCSATIHHTSLQRQLLYSTYPHEQEKYCSAILFVVQACSGSCCIHHTLMNRRNVAMFVFQFSILVVFILKYCQKSLFPYCSRSFIYSLYSSHQPAVVVAVFITPYEQEKRSNVFVFQLNSRLVF